MDDLFPEIICKSCGTPFRGNFCSNCGEKVLRAEDRSFKAVLNGLFRAVTLADGTIVKTLWLMITRPGYISRKYVSGIRVNYLKPLSLFFALNLIYFLFPFIQLFNATLKTQLRSPLKVIIRDAAAHKMIDLGVLDINSFTLLYDQKTAGLAKLIILIFVIIASLPLNVLYRKKELFFGDHLTFMTELICFNLFINAIVLTLILRFTGLGHYADDQVLTVVFALTNFYFLISSGRIFYHESGWRLVAKSVSMLLVLDVSLEIYRAILFVVTIRSL